MLITADGRTVGALSGGCLEEEVAVRAGEVFATGQTAPAPVSTPASATAATARSTSCSRWRTPTLLEQLAAAQRDRRECLIATIFENSHSLGSHLLASPEDAPPGAFLQTIPPPLRLLLIGDGPDSPALRGLAAVLGWEIVETEEAATLPNDLDQWTAAVIKTHNYGRDYAALETLLPLGLPYVALLGPRLRRDQLLHTLLETGLEVRSQLFSPAGLYLGAESPEQIALAIVAEIQSVFAAASAQSLRDWKRPIHPPVAVAATPA